MSESDADAPWWGGLAMVGIVALIVVVIFVGFASVGFVSAWMDEHVTGPWADRMEKRMEARQARKQAEREGGEG